jgi:hypothetical protein
MAIKKASCMGNVRELSECKASGLTCGSFELEDSGLTDGLFPYLCVYP